MLPPGSVSEVSVGQDADIRGHGEHLAGGGGREIPLADSHHRPSGRLESKEICTSQVPACGKEVALRGHCSGVTAGDVGKRQDCKSWEQDPRFPIQPHSADVHVFLPPHTHI